VTKIVTGWEQFFENIRESLKEIIQLNRSKDDFLEHLNSPINKKVDPDETSYKSNRDRDANISKVVYYIKNDPARWYKVNWIIVSTSHAIYKTQGGRGHKIRQNIHHQLWSIAQRKIPFLKDIQFLIKSQGIVSAKLNGIIGFGISFLF